MQENTFWSDSMDLRLFNDAAVPGALTLPGPLVSIFQTALAGWGCKVIDQRVAVAGTSNLHPQWELTLPPGVVPGVVEKIEELLRGRSITFTRHAAANDSEMVDVRWDLGNVSVWK